MPPAAAAPGAAPRPSLVRAIGRWDLTAALVNGVVGSAVFGLPSRLVELVGSLSPLACLLAGLGVLTIVLCFAEVASRFQEAGGPYLYARESFGRWTGFEVGWLTFWVRVASLSANLNVFVLYLGQLVPEAAAPAGRAATMTLVVVLVTAVNLAGVRQATWSVDLFTVAKLAPLALLAVLGLARIRTATLATQAVAQPDWTQALLLLMFAYGGFEAPLIPAAEARSPRRDTAFALVVALAIIAALYMLVQLAVVGVVPHAALSAAPVADALGALLGAPGAVLASIAALVSVWGYATGATLQSPRLLYAMSERGELPAPLARIHPRFRTPDRAIVVFSALALALALYGSFEWNATLSAIVRLLTYGLVCAALPVLRARRPDEAPGFRLPAAALIVALALGFCLWLLLTRTFAQAWILVLLVAVGALLFRGAGAARPAPQGGLQD